MRALFFIVILVVMFVLLYGTVRLLSMVFPEDIVKYIFAMGVCAGVGSLAVLLFGGTVLYGALGGALLGIALAYISR